MAAKSFDAGHCDRRVSLIEKKEARQIAALSLAAKSRRVF
jgi:hypothetical protein